MTVAELRKALKGLPGKMRVEIMDFPHNSREAEKVVGGVDCTSQDAPDFVVICSGDGEPAK